MADLNEKEYAPDIHLILCEGKPPFSYVSNTIRTPDGTIIRSRNRHDFISHVDNNGITYMVDGGLHYLRRYAATDIEELSVPFEAEYPLVRKAFEWGVSDQKGGIRYVPLSSLGTNHIRNIIKDGYEEVYCLMKAELLYREHHDIFIEETALHSLKITYSKTPKT